MGLRAYFGQKHLHSFKESLKASHIDLSFAAMAAKRRASASQKEDYGATACQPITVRAGPGRARACLVGKSPGPKAERLLTRPVPAGPPTGVGEHLFAPLGGRYTPS